MRSICLASQVKEGGGKEVLEAGALRRVRSTTARFTPHCVHAAISLPENFSDPARALADPTDVGALRWACQVEWATWAGLPFPAGTLSLDKMRMLREKL